MKLLADLHISPSTVEFLRKRGVDVVRVNECLYPSATDREILAFARADERVVLTQDLDFSSLIALSG